MFFYEARTEATNNEGFVSLQFDNKQKLLRISTKFHQLLCKKVLKFVILNTIYKTYGFCKYTYFHQKIWYQLSSLQLQKLYNETI